MPVCERCLGLYLGALWSLVLVLALRPLPTKAMLWLHGLAMLSMVPFGYHLVPHGPVVRTVTGFVFGLGMMYYLLLVPAEMLGWERLATNRSLMPFVAVALVPLPVIVSTAQYGSAVAGSLLSLLALAGLAVTALLALGNAVALCDRLVAGRQKAPV